MLRKVNVAEKLSQINDYWKPRIVGELNGHEVKVVKFRGPFVWHHHDNEDELFFCVSGRLQIQFRDHSVELEAGDLFIVPRGVEHCSSAAEEAHVLIFEPAGTRNTGNVEDPEFTAQAIPV